MRVIEVFIKSRVRGTSETVVGDAEVQDQRHQVRRIRKVGSQLDVPTVLTSAFSHLCFHAKMSRLAYFVCCAKKRSASS